MHLPIAFDLSAFCILLSICGNKEMFIFYVILIAEDHNLVFTKVSYLFTNAFYHEVLCFLSVL